MPDCLLSPPLDVVMLRTLLLLLALNTPVESSPPRVGEVFPDLKFPVLGEDRLGTVSDYRGAKVLLIQFASW